MAVHPRWHFPGLQWPERLGTPSMRPVSVLMPLHFSGDRSFFFMRSSMRTKIKIALGICLPTKLDLLLTCRGGRLLVPALPSTSSQPWTRPRGVWGGQCCPGCSVWWDKTQQREGRMVSAEAACSPAFSTANKSPQRLFQMTAGAEDLEQGSSRAQGEKNLKNTRKDCPWKFLSSSTEHRLLAQYATSKKLGSRK